MRPARASGDRHAGIVRGVGWGQRRRHPIAFQPVSAFDAALQPCLGDDLLSYRQEDERMLLRLAAWPRGSANDPCTTLRSASSAGSSSSSGSSTLFLQPAARGRPVLAPAGLPAWSALLRLLVPSSAPVDAPTDAPSSTRRPALELPVEAPARGGGGSREGGLSLGANEREEPARRLRSYPGMLRRAQALERIRRPDRRSARSSHEDHRRGRRRGGGGGGEGGAVGASGLFSPHHPTDSPM